MRTVLRYVIGYALGVGLFFGALPLALVSLSRSLDPILGTATAGLPSPRTALALVLAAVGFVFSLGSNASLLFVGRGGPTDGFGVAVSPRTRNLVTTGLYRYTRNPMVFGTNLVYLALVVYLGSLSGLLALALFVAALVPYLRWTEERRLQTDFGEGYLAYRRRTPLLFPWLPSSKDEPRALSSDCLERPTVGPETSDMGRSSARGVFVASGSAFRR